MYLFTRSGRFIPGVIREATAFMRTVTDKVQQESGLEVHSWISTMSPDTGTAIWAAFVDDLEHLEEANDKLLVSDSFAEVAAQGAKLLAGPLTDGLAQVVYGEIDPAAALPNYLSVARATAANGHVADAVNFGIEIAETAVRITGVPTLFMVELTGEYGGCRWGTRYGSIGDLERAEVALMNDQGWLELIDRVGPAYAQGATQSIYRRLV